MKRKSLFSIEVLAYILKFVFGIVAIFMVYLMVKDAIELFDVLFTKHSELYNYGSLRKGDVKHPFLAYLYDHQYSIYGNNATKIGDGVPFKTSIVLYYLFGVLSNFILFIICCIAVIFFHKISERKVFDKKNARKLLLIAILIIAIPLLNLVGDQIILHNTTKAINSVIDNKDNYLSPGVKFLGMDYTYLVTALFTLSLYFFVSKGEEEIEYSIKHLKDNQKK